jgi:hypothetical protein
MITLNLNISKSKLRFLDLQVSLTLQICRIEGEI